MVLKVYSPSKIVFHLLPLSLLIGTPGATGRVIVDDTDPRIQYSLAVSAIDGFGINFNKTQLLNGTAHYSATTLELPFLTFNFTGTSIEVRYVNNGFQTQEFYYSIDGNRTLSSFPSLQTNSSVPFLYNQSLFNVTGLRNTEHTLQVNMVYIIFDYLVYEEIDIMTTSSTLEIDVMTTSSTLYVHPTGSAVGNDPHGSPPSSVESRLIIGGIVSGLFVLLVVVLCWFLRRRGSTGRGLRMAPYMNEMVRDLTGPSESTLNRVENRVQEPLREEPVEAGWMSREA